MSKASQASWQQARLAQSKCGTAHHGQCTTGPVFNKGEAEVTLRVDGWDFQSSTVEWVKGELRGRLSWTPNYCDPASASGEVKTGTAWWLARPYGRGSIPVLGGRPAE